MRMFLAQIVTVVGAQFSIVAVPQQIYEITGSSAYVGLSGIVALVPLVLFGLWGGALSDAMDRRTLLVVSTAGLILTTFGLFLQAVLGNENVWVVLALLAAQQSFFSVGNPTRTAILPRLLPIDQLPAAASLNTTVMSFGAVAGPVLAGALIPAIGLGALYLLDSVAMLATLWAAVRLPGLPPESASGVPGLRSVIAGFVYLAQQKVLLASYVVDLVAMVFGMARALFPEIAHESFGDPASGGFALGILYASMAAGALLGGVFSGWVSRIERHGLAVLWSVAGWGLAVIGFGAVVLLASPGDGSWLLALAALFLALGGAADLISSSFRQAILLSAANEDMRGRLQSVFYIVVAGGPRLGDWSHGYAGAMFGPAPAVIGGGALVLAGTAASSLGFPAFRRYRAGEGTGESGRRASDSSGRRAQDGPGGQGSSGVRETPVSG